MHSPDAWLTDTVSVGVTLSVIYTTGTVRVSWSSTSVTARITFSAIVLTEFSVPMFITFT